MNITRKAVLGAVATVAVAGLAFGIAPAANADPVGSPSPRLLNGVGSDTTQDVNNGLASLITVGGSLALGSWDATPQPSTITPIATTFNRPNGSGSGVTALRSAKETGITVGSPSGAIDLPSGELQFARSSSAPSNSQLSTSGKYYYIPLAADAVTFAVHPSNGVIPTGASGNYEVPLGTAVGDDADSDGIYDLTLKNIFGNHAGAASFSVESTATGTLTVGDQTSGSDIVPFIPQAGSGTRSFWQSTISSFGPQAKDFYVEAGVTKSVQEHNGAVLSVVSGAIIPFSIAQHIAQTNEHNTPGYYSGTYSGVTVVDRLNDAILGDIDGEEPLNGAGELNTDFPVKRPVFTVVEVAEWNSGSTVGNALKSVFDGPTASAYTTLSPAVGSTTNVLADFGFGLLDGGVDFTINGATYLDVTPGETSYTSGGVTVERFRAIP